MKTIVVIDDQKAVHLITGALLSKLGFNTKNFYSAEEAFRFLEKNEADLIITDLNMPQMNGFEFIEKVNRLLKKNSYHCYERNILCFERC